MSDLTLFNRIQAAMKAALLAKEQRRLNVVRLMIAAIKQCEIDQRTTGTSVALTDAQIIAVLDKMMKQRRDSLEQYQQAGRQDLADQEAYEITVIEEFLPTPLSDSELEGLIQEAISSTGAASASDMGKVMAHIKPQVQGRADMKELSNKIKQRLNA